MKPSDLFAQRCIRWLVILASLPVWFGCSRSWETYQSQYRQILSEIKPESSNTFEFGIRSVGHEEIRVADRCTTCHLGIDDPAMSEVPQPFRTHPGNYLQKHDWQKIGCTPCHGGNGSSTEQHSAHAGMLRYEMVETRCSLCHPRDQILEGAPHTSHGKTLFRDLQCTGCHYVEGFAPPRQGPSLNGIGSRTHFKWLKYWLLNPREMIPNAKMPNFHLKEEHAAALAAYLMTFRDPEIDNTPEPPEGDIVEGGNILRRARCISCHPFNGRGGHLAPDLGRIGNKTNRTWLFAKIKDPHRFEPLSTMPQFNFTDEQIVNIVDYLFDEYTDYDLLDVFDQDSSAVPTDSATVDMGRRLYKELRCNNCHFLDNGMEWMRLGPKLTYIGEKPVEAFDFGETDFSRTREEYIFQKIRTPKIFATPKNPQKMPQFFLSDRDAYDLTLMLLSFTSNRIPSPRFAAYPDTGVYQPEGEAGKLIEKFQCFSCHRINGRGFNLAYDLSMEGSRVKREWLYDYLMVSYSIRPILVERMPIFNFTPHEAEVLTDYIMEELTSNLIPQNLESRLTPGLARQGQILFEEKGCMACHILGDKGGYVGPSFTTGALAGDKLQAGWVFRWLKNPQEIVPGVLEPNYNLSDEEALAITAYLMSLTSKESAHYGTD